MKRLRALLSRIIGTWPSEKRDRDLNDELDGHLEMYIDENLRRGMPADEARRNAIIKLGGKEGAKQIYREQRSLPIIENTIQDARFAIRQLRKNPGFTLTSIFVLMLGICASIAIFAFVDAALIRPLPYRDSHRLVGVYESAAMCPQCNLSYLDYLDWKRMNDVFESLDAWDGSRITLSTAEGPVGTRGARVTDGFFATLGVTPILGRDFRNGEDLPSAERTVILSYSAWQQRFSGSNDVLGKTVILDDLPTTIVGVLPPDFHFAPVGSPEFWTTMHAQGQCDERRSCHNLYGVARLKPGASPQSALTAMTTIARELEAQYPDSNKGQSASIVPLQQVIVGNVRPTLLGLFGGALLLLLIATVNVASLLLVRSESRRREISVRSALGASPGRLLRLFVTEGVVLVVAGCSLGLLASFWLMKLLARLIPADLMASVPFLKNVGLNSRVLGIAGIVSIIAILLFSLTPAVHFLGLKLQAGINEGSRGSAGNTWRRMGSKLVVLELVIAMVLLVCAGLLGKSLYMLLHVDLGIDRDHLAAVSVTARDAKYPKDEDMARFEHAIKDQVATLPGVESVGIASRLPVSGNGNTSWIRIVGRPFNGEHNEVNEREVSAEYFSSIRAHILRGRAFDQNDKLSKPRVVIINQTLARQYFPGEDPIGHQIGDTSLSKNSLAEIVGVVSDIKEGSLDSEIWPAIYQPIEQNPDTFLVVIVRTSQSEGAILPNLESSLRLVDKDIVTSGAGTMTSIISDSPSAYLHRSSAWMVGGFAVTALLLSVIGLYGVIAYSVSQRTREIGVRVALGARRSTIYRLIFKEAGVLAVVGIVIGLVCSIGAASLISGLLFGVSSWDMPTLAGVAIVLGLSALTATFFPAHRAASVNPVDALRAD